MGWTKELTKREEACVEEVAGGVVRKPDDGVCAACNGGDFRKHGEGVCVCVWA